MLYITMIRSKCRSKSTFPRPSPRRAVHRNFCRCDNCQHILSDCNKPILQEIVLLRCTSSSSDKSRAKLARGMLARSFNRSVFGIHSQTCITAHVATGGNRVPFHKKVIMNLRWRSCQSRVWITEGADPISRFEIGDYGGGWRRMQSKCRGTKCHDYQKQRQQYCHGH